MATINNKRIFKELEQLNASKDVLESSGVYIHYNEDNIRTVYALLIGQSETPYHNGFYFFEFTYPDTYPMTPPVAKYLTQGIVTDSTKKALSVRFNPNLYTNGKVCLSMLNTWQGPSWIPANTLHNVLIAIQGLVLTKDPLRNEPGYESGDNAQKINAYNDIIEYSNLKISVLDMICNQPLPELTVFSTIMRQHFLKNYENYVSFINNKISTGHDNKSILCTYMAQSPVITRYSELLTSIHNLNTTLNHSINSDLSGGVGSAFDKIYKSILDSINSSVAAISAITGYVPNPEPNKLKLEHIASFSQNDIQNIFNNMNNNNFSDDDENDENYEIDENDDGEETKNYDKIQKISFQKPITMLGPFESDDDE